MRRLPARARAPGSCPGAFGARSGRGVRGPAGRFAVPAFLAPGVLSFPRPMRRSRSARAGRTEAASVQKAAAGRHRAAAEHERTSFGAGAWSGTPGSALREYAISPLPRREDRLEGGHRGGECGYEGHAGECLRRWDSLPGHPGDHGVATPGRALSRAASTAGPATTLPPAPRGRWWRRGNRLKGIGENDPGLHAQQPSGGGSPATG